MLEDVVSITTGAAIIASLAQALKGWGVRSEIIPVIVIIIGLLFGVSLAFALHYPIWTGLVYGFVIGSGTAWGYDAQKGIRTIIAEVLKERKKK